MGNQGILRGWTAWQEMWEEAARQKRMLAAAGARLAKPKLAACFSLWTASWLETEKLKSTKGIGQMLLDKEKECDTLQAEVASLTEELAAVRAQETHAAAPTRRQGNRAIDVPTPSPNDSELARSTCVRPDFWAG